MNGSDVALFTAERVLLTIGAAAARTDCRVFAMMTETYRLAARPTPFVVTLLSFTHPLRVTAMPGLHRTHVPVQEPEPVPVQCKIHAG